MRSDVWREPALFRTGQHEFLNAAALTVRLGHSTSVTLDEASSGDGQLNNAVATF